MSARDGAIEGWAAGANVGFRGCTGIECPGRDVVRRLAASRRRTRRMRRTVAIRWIP